MERREKNLLSGDVRVKHRSKDRGSGCGWGKLGDGC